MEVSVESTIMWTLPAGEQMVEGISMEGMLQFGRSILNPAGIEWGVGSGDDVGSDLYIVAPVVSSPGRSGLYKVDPTTGEATILGVLGVEDPTDIA